MRHYVLVSYDVSEPRRLRRMFRLMRGYGDHLQYSVFLCQLTEKDKVVLIEKIKDILLPSEDQAILMNLGKVDGLRSAVPEKWDVVGHSVMMKWTLSTRQKEVEFKVATRRFIMPLPVAAL